MIIYKKHFLIVIISLLACAPLIAGYALKHKMSSFSCEGEVFVKSKDAGAHVIMHYKFHNGKGTYNSTGKAYEKNAPAFSINRNFTFRYIPEVDSFTLLSLEDDNNKDNLAHHTAIVPDFFRFKDRGLTIRVNKENSNGYLVLQGDTPVFYCKK